MLFFVVGINKVCVKYRFYGKLCSLGGKIIFI